MVVKGGGDWPFVALCFNGSYAQEAVDSKPLSVSVVQVRDRP
jgi:hypothetical protein